MYTGIGRLILNTTQRDDFDLEIIKVFSFECELPWRRRIYIARKIIKR